jgi:hypothetical protein
MIPLALLLTSIPPGSRDLLEFGFFVTVGMTAGSLGIDMINFAEIYQMVFMTVVGVIMITTMFMTMMAYMIED